MTIQDVERSLTRWLETKAVYDELVQQFQPFVDLQPGQDIPNPQRGPSEKGLEQIDEAFKNMEAAYKRYRAAQERLWAIQR